MSGNTWRTILAIVVMTHGVGHVLFAVPCLGIAQWGQSTHSWLLTRGLGDTLTRAIGTLIWLAVIAAFTAAGVGLLGQHTWWRPVAVAAAGISLLGIVIFAHGGDVQSQLSAGLMSVAILVALLWIRWPAVDLVGA
jgi:hypothetical protein